MTEFYLSKKNGRTFYKESIHQDETHHDVLTTSLSFVKEHAAIMEEQRTSPKRYETVKHKVPSHIVGAQKSPSPKREEKKTKYESSFVKEERKFESKFSPASKKKIEAVSERIKNREEQIRQ